MYGTQVSTRPPRFRIFVNDPSLVTRDYGYWVENELRAALRARRRAGVDRLRRRDEPRVSDTVRWVTVASSSGRLVGDGVRRAPRATTGTRSRSRAAIRAQAARDRATGRNPQYLGTSTCAGSPRVHVDGRAGRASAELVVVAVPSASFGEVVGSLPGRRAVAQPHEGPRSGRPANGSRHSCADGPWRCSPVRTSPTRSCEGCPPRR